MTKKEVRKSALTSILEGKSKQETFESLSKTSNLPTKALANIIQSIPSLYDRQRYKSLNALLIFLISLTILYKLITEITLLVETEIKWFDFPFLPLIIYIVSLIGVIKFSVGMHRFVALYSTYELINYLSEIKSFDPLKFYELAIAAALIGIGFYLHTKLFPKYIIVEEQYINSEGEDKLREVIKFND